MRNAKPFSSRNCSSIINTHRRRRRIHRRLSLQFPPSTTNPEKDSIPKTPSPPPIAMRVSFHLPKSSTGSLKSHCRKRVSSCRRWWTPVHFYTRFSSLDRFLNGDIHHRHSNRFICRRLEFHFLHRYRRSPTVIVGLSTRRGLCFYPRIRILKPQPNSRGLFSTDLQQSN